MKQVSYDPTDVNTILYWVRFQVLTAMSTKITVFWDIALCCLLESDQHFRGAHCLHQGDESHLITLMMEAVGTSETSVNFYQTTRCNIQENSHLQFCTGYLHSTVQSSLILSRISISVLSGCNQITFIPLGKRPVGIQRRGSLTFVCVAFEITNMNMDYGCGRRRNSAWRLLVHSQIYSEV
jgi:hypothetical protein